MFNMKQPPVDCEYTFYMDFQIADKFGEKGVRDTYNSVKKGWLSDPAAWGEVVCALNWRLWDLYKTDEAIARVYQELWGDAEQLGWKQFENNKEASSIFYGKID